MGFRFVHTADWQLGKPFGGFGPERAARLQEARLGIVQRVADLARREGAHHVLVAGDVWDQETPSNAVLRQPLDRMAQASDLTWWLLPGNHDPAKQFEESLWDRLRAWSVPPHIRLLTEAEPHEMERGITLLPAPWHSKRPGKDLTTWFGGEGTRIGLAHGGTMSISSSEDDSAVIAADRAEKAGLAYLALGDWHAFKKAAPRTYYPGTPEPDDYRNTEQGKALVVDLDDPDAPMVHHLGIYDWKRIEAALEGVTDLEGILTSDGPLDQRLLRLKLSGHLTHEERAELEARLSEEADRFFALDADWSGVTTLLDGETLDARLGEGLLKRVAGRLADMEGQPQAGEALRYLSRFVRS